MKKKLIAVLLCSTLLFSFTACSSSDSKTDDGKDKPIVSATPEAGSDKTDNPDVSDGDATDGNTDTDGDVTDPDTDSDGSKPATEPTVTAEPGTPTDPGTTVKPDTTTDPSTNTDSRSLKGMENFLINAGVLSGAREEIDPSIIGAIAGVRYPKSNVEIYQFDTSSENYNLLAMGECISVSVSGKDVYYYADSANNGFILVGLNEADTEAISSVFGGY